MNRRSLLASALLAGAGLGGLNKVDTALSPLSKEADAARVLARWQKAIERAHGQDAFDSYGDIIEESARAIARSADQPRYRDRIARGEELWVQVVGEFERPEWDGWR